MGLKKWLNGTQDEISFRLIAGTIPVSAGYVKITLIPDGAAYVETAMGLAPQAGSWETSYDTCLRLQVTIPTISPLHPQAIVNIELDLQFMLLVHTHTFMSINDSSSFLSLWKRIEHGPSIHHIRL
jgi:hypothetical protein